MIEITSAAQSHFRAILEQQGGEDFDVRVSVASPGTPAATVELGFCEPGDLAGDEVAIRMQGFTLYVDAASVSWLDRARVDYEPARGGGRMKIAAPGIRGEVPEADAGLAARVRYIIDSEVNPQLAAHHGEVKLVQIDPGSIVVLEFGGGCHGCGMVDITLKQGVEKTLRKRLPEIRGVRDVTDHASGTNPFYRRRDGVSAIGGARREDEAHA